MITVTVRKKKQGGRIVALEIKGHSGYASGGNDIVCSAVSALTQALAVGLFEVLELDERKVIFEADSKQTLMRVSGLEHADDPRAEAIVETIYRSLSGIEATYGGYIRVTEVFI